MRNLFTASRSTDAADSECTAATACNGHAVSSATGVGFDSAAWEREMRRVRTSSRVLGVFLVAVVVKTVISGPRFGVVLAGTLDTLLLFVSLLLTRLGRRLDPRSRSHAPIDEP
jgi:hypothetical protein